MDINITGRNAEITDRFRVYATEKADKIAQLAEKSISLDIKVSRHSEKSGGSAGDDRVEITLVGPGPVIRAESSAADKFAAFDLALGRMLERLRRAKDKKKIHRGNHRPVSLHEAATEGFAQIDLDPADVELIERVNGKGVAPADQPVEEDDYCPVVIRTKVFPSQSMTVDQALEHMELVGHDFFLFIDAETDRPSVVYRRKGWDYGVIGLADGEQELAGAGAGSRALRR
ncbi:ribosome hibernation-promoting factor, HPF/YfiA family [Clavibacter sp. Sh2088]|jgi:ribosomal subunit interface protein|uniref:ribosome hibernation-promoting factor, HPF/YfiA family n=1 Tax=Clavibacter sp. Sh2088 TaxID=3397676 RepID=UPI0039E1E328